MIVNVTSLLTNKGCIWCCTSAICQNNYCCNFVSFTSTQQIIL